VHVDIKLQDVGGPSAGLMFALGIVDKLQPGSLTGGRVVAGTGEIDESGKVGAIGGIAQKMRGAVKAGATVFLVPSANCDEARRTRPDHLQLVRVGTIQDALDGLAALRAGRTPASC
jgi:PDZ domain-containing protein